MLSTVTEACGAPGEVSADAVGRSDFDGDGQEDILLSWSGVRCATGPYAGQPGAGNCGAGTCEITAFVSGAYAQGQPPFGFIAISAVPDPDSPSDIRTHEPLSVCNQLGLQPECLSRSRWTGSRFELVPN